MKSKLFSQYILLIQKNKVKKDQRVKKRTSFDLQKNIFMR